MAGHHLKSYCGAVSATILESAILINTNTTEFETAPVTGSGDNG